MWGFRASALFGEVMKEPARPRFAPLGEVDGAGDTRQDMLRAVRTVRSMSRAVFPSVVTRGQRPFVTVTGTG